MNQAAVSVSRLSHNFGSTKVVDDVSFDIMPRERVAIVGPSGCGKTTVLNLVAGLERLQGGEIAVQGGRSDSKDRCVIGYAFARDALLPWRTALRNVALPLELDGVPRKIAASRAREELQRVGLGDYCGAYRSELSQGMRQRVALARTLVRRPDVLLMDEPFAALDAQTRIVMQGQLAQVAEQIQATILFITHDIGEAIAISDRVLLMTSRPGQIGATFDVRLGWPRDPSALQDDPQYLNLYGQIWQRLREELKGAFGELPSGTVSSEQTSAGLVYEQKREDASNPLSVAKAKDEGVISWQESG